jgi:putative Mn2+ efflux pump MntP
MDFGNTISIMAVAVALGADAFSVAVGVAGPFQGQNFRIAWHFGLFQALMPLIGWVLGKGMDRWVGQWDHWVAFFLLLGVGGHMLWEAMTHGEERAQTDRSRKWSLVMLSTAVSIDALVVGVAFGVREISPWWPCLLIGITTGIMSLIGLHLGRRAKAKFGKPAEILGGIVLIGLAVKFLVGM